MSASKRAPTIAEVAAACNVSQTTVSRYLNGKFEFMSAVTKQRIEKTIEELDYRPNQHARSLKSNKSGLIGVSVSDITSPFSSILVKGIGDYFEKRGYQIIIGNCDDNPAKERSYIQSLIDHRVDGLIINTAGSNDEFLIDVQKMDVPIVLADRPISIPGIDTVTNNGYDMTASVVRELHKTGYGRIGFFTQKIDGNLSRMLRRDAFVDVCANDFHWNGETHVHVVDVNQPDSIRSAIEHFVQQNLGDLPGPPAILTVNGVTLLAIVEQVIKLGISMPAELGVCGFDDWAWAPLIPPGITAIAQPTYEIGVESAKLLLSRLAGKKSRKAKLVEIPATLHKRGSTQLQ